MNFHINWLSDYTFILVNVHDDVHSLYAMINTLCSQNQNQHTFHV